MDTQENSKVFYSNDKLIMYHQKWWILAQKYLFFNFSKKGSLLNFNPTSENYIDFTIRNVISFGSTTHTKKNSFYVINYEIRSH